MSSSRHNSLLAALQRATVQADPTAVPAPAAKAIKTSAAAKPVKSKGSGSRAAAVQVPPVQPTRGKPVQFWMHEQDRKLIREFSAWLAGQGIRPTDSMVIRAALRAVRPGTGYLEAYRQAALLDGRLRPRD
jgi:hypothetical protein